MSQLRVELTEKILENKRSIVSNTEEIVALRQDLLDTIRLVTQLAESVRILCDQVSCDELDSIKTQSDHPSTF